MTNRKIRIGYAISVFAISLALLFVGVFFFTSNPLINSLLNNITDIFIASMIFSEILLLSIFVFFITNPEFTKARKLGITAVFIFLMILDYLISAYLYTQPFICTHLLFFGTNHFQIRDIYAYAHYNGTTPYFSFVNYNGTYVPTKLYLYLYILNMPPFETTIPNLNGTILFINFKIYSAMSSNSGQYLQVLYITKVPYKIVEENITTQNNFPLLVGSLIYSNNFYVLTLEPLNSSTNTINISLNNNPLISHTGIVVSEVEYPNGQNFICQGIS